MKAQLSKASESPNHPVLNQPRSPYGDASRRAPRKEHWGGAARAPAKYAGAIVVGVGATYGRQFSGFGRRFAAVLLRVSPVPPTCAPQGHIAAR